jgi:hypothetical protein
MKTSLIAFALILSTSLFAQDSSRITQTITLSRLHHTYLIGFMGNIQTADKIKYVNQVKSGYDTTNMSQTVAVTASSSLILEIFYVMSQQPEGWTSEYNNQIKAALYLK